MVCLALDQQIRSWSPVCHLTLMLSEFEPFNRMECVLLSRMSSIESMVFPLMPQKCRFRSSSGEQF